MKKNGELIKFVETFIDRKLYDYEICMLAGMQNKMHSKGEHICEHCGIDLSDRHYTTRFCYDCAQNRKYIKKKLTVIKEKGKVKNMKNVIMEGVTFNEVLKIKLEDMLKKGNVSEESLIRELNKATKVIDMQTQSLLIAEKAINELANISTMSDESRKEIFAIIGKTIKEEK